jgi:ABC-2 type transport system ATP-binding protein
LDAVRSSAIKTIQVDTDRVPDAARVLTELGLTDISQHASSVTGTLGDVAVEKIVPNLVNDDVPVLGFAVLKPSLEDVFVSLTGEGFDVSG